MTPSGIEPATFRFVAQHLNNCATAVPNNNSNNDILVIIMKKELVCEQTLQFQEFDMSSKKKPKRF